MVGLVLVLALLRSLIDLVVQDRRQRVVPASAAEIFYLANWKVADSPSEI